jgi:hypothetical protein
VNALCELTLPANVLKTLSEFPPLVVESLRTALMAAFANRKLGQTSRIAKVSIVQLVSCRCRAIRSSVRLLQHASRRPAAVISCRQGRVVRLPSRQSVNVRPFPFAGFRQVGHETARGRSVYMGRCAARPRPGDVIASRNLDDNRVRRRSRLT